jgi:hypothetical protein
MIDVMVELICTGEHEREILRVGNKVTGPDNVVTVPHPSESLHPVSSKRWRS